MKQTKLILTILLAALLLPTSALGLTDYGFSVCDVRVTSDNCNNITAPSLTGKAFYDPASNVLTLDNCQADGGDDMQSAIAFDQSILDEVRLGTGTASITIKLIGTTAFANFNQAVVCPNLTFIGEGSDASIILGGKWNFSVTGTLTIDGCTVSSTTSAGKDNAISSHYLKMKNGAALIGKATEGNSAVRVSRGAPELESGIEILTSGVKFGNNNEKGYYYLYSDEACTTFANEVMIGPKSGGTEVKEGEVEAITSTFTKLGSDIQRTEFYSAGSILTEEGNDWYFVSSATVLMNGSAGSFGLRLRGVSVGLQSYYDLTGLVKKVTVRAGGNLSEIGVMINDARQSVTVTSTDVQDYVFDFGDGVYVDYHKDAVGTNKTYISVDLTPKDDNYDNPTIVECVKVECIREKSGSKEKGNLNGDGVVDANDVVALLSYLAGSKPSGFNEAAADVNKDGKVDIADIIALVNLLLGK